MCSAIGAERPFALIVGAGPSGLVLANILQKYGKKFVLIEQNQGCSTLSKATGLHANTMRLLAKLNLAHVITQKATELNKMNQIVDGKLSKEVVFRQGQDVNDKNQTISQPTLEEIFLKALAPQSSAVQFGCKLLNFEQSEDGVTAEVQEVKTSSKFTIQTSYLIACDGAKSSIRKKLQVPFEGEKTPEWSFTFDAEVKTPLKPHEMFMFTKGVERLVVVPIPEGYKFSGRVTDAWYEEQRENSASSRATALASLVLHRSGIEINEASIKGFSLYHTCSRVAASMRQKRVILLGDAAHVFFPHGGYGLNTALEDAFSLAWRMAFAVQGVVHESLLSSFSEERLKNAKEIQLDSTEKKKQQESTAAAPQSLREQEKQTYTQHSPDAKKLHLVRLETLLPFQTCKAAVNFQGMRLIDALTKNIGFTLIVPLTAQERLAQLQAAVNELNSHLPIAFNLVCVYANHARLSLEQAKPNYFSSQDFSETDTAILVRPDNFCYRLPLEQAADCNGLLETLHLRKS